MSTPVRAEAPPFSAFLVVLPLALFVSATLFDLGTLVSGWRGFGKVGYFDLIGGLVVGALVALLGVVDQVRLPAGRLDPRRLEGPAALDLAMLGTFLLACLLRTGDQVAGGWIFTLQLIALGLGIGATRMARRIETARPTGLRLTRPVGDRPAGADLTEPVGATEPVRASAVVRATASVRVTRPISARSDSSRPDGPPRPVLPRPRQTTLDVTPSAAQPKSGGRPKPAGAVQPRPAVPRPAVPRFSGAQPRPIASTLPQRPGMSSSSK